MNPQKKRPVIIVTPLEEVWYQETVDEQLSLSFLGRIKDMEDLRRFCAAHNIDFEIYRSKRDR